MQIKRRQKKISYRFSKYTLAGCIILVFCTVISYKIPIKTIPAKFLLSAMTRAVSAIDMAGSISLRFSPYDILESTIPSIKASDVMTKKYAAKYGGIVRKDSEKQEQILKKMDNSPVLEGDYSTKGITYINTPALPVDTNELLTQKLGFYPQDGAPRVLIVHTHTSEAYAESPNSRNEDNAYNVVAVGKVLKKTLEGYGIGVIHDVTKNDNPSYNKSYTKALTVIEKNLATYPTLEIVIDLHRDYIKKDDGTLIKPTTTLKNGQKAAQIMFVMGTDAMGLYHPNWRHNLAFAAQIQNRLQTTTPGLCRSVNIRTERFNQHATKGSMIIEIGTGVNTLQEAKNAAKELGDAIAYILKNIS